MMSKSYESRDFEVQIAATLALTWDSYWESGPTVIAGETPHSTFLAERAVSLYSFTNQILESAWRQGDVVSEPGL